MFVQEDGERRWFAEQFESTRFNQLTNDEKINIAKLLVKCDTFDNFMQVSQDIASL